MFGKSRGQAKGLWLKFASSLACVETPSAPRGKLVTPGGFEPPTYGVANRHSVLLSYGAILVCVS